MSWLFSKRCKQSLKEKKLKVSIPLTVRIRIWELFTRSNESYSETTDTGFNYWTSTLEQLPGRIKAELGSELLAFPETGGEVKPSDLKSFVLRGNYPPYLFDTLELFYESICPDSQNQFQRYLNEIIAENNLPWRMADGKIFPVDSAYIEEEIIRRAYSLLHEVRFQGALQEFEKARADLSNNDYEGAIQNANLAVESAIKGVLKIERAKPGELFRKLVDAGIVPQYYKGFLKAFEENILRCVAIIRNEELGVGHGQGIEVNKIPSTLAGLAVNLAGVLIKFLITHYLEQTREEVQSEDLEPF